MGTLRSITVGKNNMIVNESTLFLFTQRHNFLGIMVAVTKEVDSSPDAQPKCAVLHSVSCLHYISLSQVLHNHI